METLVATAIVTTLALLAFPWARNVLAQGKQARCMAKISSCGRGVLLYAQDHGGTFPRSFHSGGAHREPGWWASIAPYLGQGETFTADTWQRVAERLYRCPEDARQSVNSLSYGMNAYYELDPAQGDNYEGSPATWRRMASVPRPARTVLLAETRSGDFADHFMCHQWSSLDAARNAVAHDWHGGRSHYVFADGHVERLAVEQTFQPLEGVNLWNPSLAR